ncbi:SUMF1/EgtB/PvdO family nonheme iron enzyme [Pelagibacterium halotolerans]|uniref:SUMF1/EgtB/PvdO family nonheme iron enzyme n=1 Tax=Pelagibacterium halotolerans TaxID=531813 RepID=UPI0038513B19
MAQRIEIGPAASLAAPVLLLAALGAVIAGLSLPEHAGQGVQFEPDIETVQVPRGRFEYVLPGEFTVGGHVVGAPVESVFLRGALEVMKYQVSVADYARCVTDGACLALDENTPVDPDLPVTGVSYTDAEAYASWLSNVTGETWRLPTDVEAAHYRMAEAETAIEAPTDSFVSQWLAEYREYADRSQVGRSMVQPLGAFGENVFGVADANGNLWEWTSTCYARVRFDNGGDEISRHENCGVRTLQGEHRAYLSVFIRDAVVGACAVGVPPDHLGIRLIRERHWYDPLIKAVRQIVQPIFA